MKLGNSVSDLTSKRIFKSVNSLSWGIVGDHVNRPYSVYRTSRYTM